MAVSNLSILLFWDYWCESFISTCLSPLDQYSFSCVTKGFSLILNSFFGLHFQLQIRFLMYYSQTKETCHCLFVFLLVLIYERFATSFNNDQIANGLLPQWQWHVYHKVGKLLVHSSPRKQKVVKSSFAIPTNLYPSLKILGGTKYSQATKRPIL